MNRISKRGFFEGDRDNLFEIPVWTRMLIGASLLMFNHRRQVAEGPRVLKVTWKLGEKEGGIYKV